jgi:hypothetical protein
VYVAHAPESDPATCHARNIHGRSLEDVQKAAAAWEPLPPLFAQLDLKGLLREAAGGHSRAAGAGAAAGPCRCRAAGLEAGGCALCRRLHLGLQLHEPQPGPAAR